MTRRWMMVLVGGLLAVQAFAEEPPVLKTPLEKLSYGLGVDMGKNLKRQGTEMNPDIVLKGLKDAMAGDKLQMSDEELMTTMKTFAAERRAKQSKDKPAAKDNQTRIEDLETIYAIGLILARQLSDFDLTLGELELVKQGITHAVTGKGPSSDLDPFMDKIN